MAYNFDFAVDYLVKSISDKTCTLRDKRRPSEDPLTNVPVALTGMNREEMFDTPHNSLKVIIAKQALGSFSISGTTTIELDGKQYQLNEISGSGHNSLSSSQFIGYIEV